MNTVNTGQSRLTLIGVFRTTVHNRNVTYTLKRSSKATLIWLDIKWKTGLTVIVPLSYDIDRLPEYLEMNWQWIHRNLAKFCENISHSPQNSLQKDNSIPYMGKYLEISPKQNHCNINTVKLEKNRLVVNMDPLEGGTLNHGLEMWYRLQADQLIREKVRTTSLKMGLAYNRVVIRGQRTRWGSCSCKKNLNFNWRIIMAPEPVIDYVVIHELSHLKQMNHSKKFWNIVAKYCPQWHDSREWLNNHTVDLNTILPIQNIEYNTLPALP
jgi:predicted metal-dependent hydrolase